MKVLIVVGTRPEIIKMAPLIHECEKRGTDNFFLHTGQHFSTTMSDQFFKDLDLRTPDQNLNIGSGTHSEQTAKALIGIEKVLIRYQPDVVLVQGDTNAVLSATIAAVKLHIPVGHVEAGLRSYDMRMPEEHNRRLTDHASTFLFAPTQTSADILMKENVWGEIHVTGNTVIDTLESVVDKIRERVVNDQIPEDFALLTLHRAENVDDRKTLSGLIEGLSGLGLEIIFPAHPRTVARLKEYDLWSHILAEGKIKIIEPAGYRDFVEMMYKAQFIITDSGGIQEEVTSPSLNKRAFVLRTSTERPEAVTSGHVAVIGVDPNEFPKRITHILQRGALPDSPCPYGKGDASMRIMDILEKKLKI
ncbi:MAG: non-hydrolyzing UDP-N-acetylglucosamine 2-epimerase [Candidatus Thorarchaeota archaeon]